MNLLMQGIEKSFGKNHVLKGVDFEVKTGEIHALVGENGAGKSTLMNILTGILEKDGGKILLDNEEFSFKKSTEALEKGIGFIHQELVDWPDMTVLENLYMGRERKKGILIDENQMKKEAHDLFERLEINLKPSQRVGNLSAGQRRMLEIAKANMENLEILIMDEPTSALTNNEIDKLFKLMAKLREDNVSIIYISHRMEEIFALTSRITVMRDGVSVATVDTKDTNVEEIVKMMVGREVGDFYPEMHRVIGEEKLRVEDFSSDIFKDISFSVREGEILGIGGLMGSGRTEIMRSIFGIDPKASGKIFIDGKEANIHNPKHAINEKIAFVTENRQEEGLILDESIEDNISIANLKEISKGIFVDKEKEKNFAQKLFEDLKVRSTGIKEFVQDLSGGNQQKVVMAKWFGNEPEILILDEPTKGVDVGAKREIYLLINEMTKRNVAVILVSSDLSELLSLSDRICVIYEGKLQGEYDREEFTQEKIMHLATGGTK